MESIEAIMQQIPEVNTALSYTEFLQMKADSYNSKVGSLKDYNCEICRNKGYIEKIVDDTEVLAECRCLKIRETLRRIKESGLESLLRTNTFKNFETPERWQQALKDAAVKFSESAEGCFYIGGQSGCGKTHLCTAIVGAMIKKGKSARYFVWREDSTILKGMLNTPEYQTAAADFKK